MFCRRCGAELPAGAAACPRCQEPVLPPGMPTGFTAPGPQPPAQSSTGLYAPPPAGQWPPQAPAGQPFPPAGEQFNPPPIPPSAWLTSSGPTGSAPPQPPPSRPLLETLFGPSPRPGIALVHTNGVQQRFLSRLQPTTAGSVWFGALAGGVLSFVVAFFLAVICSLLLGGILDQAFASVAALLNLISGSASASGGGPGISFYSNPLVLFDYAHRSTFIIKLAASTSTTPLNTSISVTPPATLLLLIPAIGLLFGGYFAASTDYTGRRLFSIMRGASVCVVYALLALLLSLVTSVDLASSSSSSGTATLTVAPDSLSVFLNSLCCGLIFGALGGALRARSFPTVTTGPLNRRNMRLSAAWLGARFSLTIFFSICLALVLALYLLAQIGGPTLQTEGSVNITNPQASTCHIFLQQPSTAPSPTLPTSLNSGLSGPVWFLVDSPPLAGWVMSLSLGAPLQISGGGLGAVLNTDVGLIGADCGPGTRGALFYLLLVIPAIAFFLGGRRAARFAYDSTAGEATGTGLLLAGMAAFGMLIIALISSITLSVLGVSINIGPSLLWSFFATLLYGAIFGVPGAILARTGTQQPGPLAYAAWPNGPGAAAPTGQATPQPPYSVAVSSVRPGTPGMPGIPSSGLPAGGAAPGSDPFHDAQTRLSGPLDLHHAPTLTSGGMAPPQAPPAFPGGADIWHAPTQAPGSGSISDALTQPSNPEGRQGPQPPNPPGPARQQ